MARHRPRAPRARALAFVFALALAATIGGANRAMAGGPIVSDQSVIGSLATPTTVESWTFSGTVGQRVLVDAVTTLGSMTAPSLPI